MRPLALLIAALLCSPAFAGSAVEILEQKCATCHGKDRKGRTKMGLRLKVPDMTTADYWRGQDDARLIKIIAEGQPRQNMPRFGDRLSEKEIKDVVKVLRSFEPK